MTRGLSVPLFVSGLAAACALATLACSPSSPPPEGGESNGGSSGATGGSSSGSGNGGGGSSGNPNGGSSGSSGATGGVGHEGFDLDCSGPELGAPVLRLLTRSELTNTIADVFPGIQGQWQSSLPASTISALGFDNDARAEVGNQLARALLETAESVATAVTGDALASLLPCASSSPDAACATEFLNRYGKRLFRRPLDAAEQTRFLDVYESVAARSDFRTGLKWMTVGLIQSPHAVYRSEIGSPASDGTRELSPYELATELAYTYTGTTPSEDLLARAESNTLGDLRALAESLLATERGKLAIQRFFEAYVDYTRVVAIEKRNVSTFAAASADMLEETRRFVDGVVLQGGGGLRELLTSPTTYVSQSLASYYGFPAPSSDFAAVTRPAGRGIGILAQGAFLATHANATASSPTQRGLFPYYRLLCQPELEVPDDVPQLGQPEPGQRTTRQRYEEVHAQPNTSCAGCHTLFDPIGFGFEHFDEAGRYREDDGGLPIDATGRVLGPTDDALFTFDGQEELVTRLAEQTITYQCFSAYLALYAFGTQTACLGPSSAPSLEAGTLGITQAFAALATEPHFSRRK